ncbi:hypothetical protein JHK86_039700 [Glycine max]|nr:hypothetical protein JHK86_039700 [Glycine max]
MHTAICSSRSIVKDAPPIDNKSFLDTSFWNTGILELVELVQRPPQGGPPSLPEQSDAICFDDRICRREAKAIHISCPISKRIFEKKMVNVVLRSSKARLLNCNSNRESSSQFLNEDFFFFFVEEVVAIVVVIRRLSWCIEEASAKSSAAVHHRGSFVTVHRRGKRRDPVLFPPLLPVIA